MTKETAEHLRDMEFDLVSASFNLRKAQEKILSLSQYSAQLDSMQTIIQKMIENRVWL